MADSAHLVPVRALSDDSSLSLYNLLVQDKVDRLKSLTADQTRRLHDHVFLGSPHRICYAARLRQQSEQKGGVFDEIVAILTQYDEQSKAHALDQELGIQPTIRLPSQPAASVVEASIAGASPVDGAFPAPSGKLLEFSAAAALPRAGSALVSSASPSAAASASVGPPRQHVMVSYAWDDAKDRVVRFCDALRQHQIDVWRDETGSSLLGPMADAVNAHMAKAVELCSTMIVCVSRKYMVSISTFSFLYFFRRHVGRIANSGKADFRCNIICLSFCSTCF